MNIHRVLIDNNKEFTDRLLVCENIQPLGNKNSTILYKACYRTPISPNSSKINYIVNRSNRCMEIELQIQYFNVNQWLDL